MPLRWDYTLSPGLALLITTIVISNGSTSDDIGFRASGVTVVNDRNDYQTRFSISITDEVSTLIINKVTEREEATFQCRLRTASHTWAYNIHVNVTGKQL